MNGKKGKERQCRGNDRRIVHEYSARSGPRGPAIVVRGGKQFGY